VGAGRKWLVDGQNDAIDPTRISKPLRRHDHRAAATIKGRLTGFSSAAPVLAFLREVINESVNRPRSIHITTHHINAARGTSQNRGSIANMAKSWRLMSDSDVQRSSTMATTDKEKPGGKTRQRSQKGSQRGPKPEPRQSPKPDQRDEDRIGHMAASTDAPTNGAAAPANEPLVVETAAVDAPLIGATAPADAASIDAAAPADAASIDAAAPPDAASIDAAAPADAASIDAAAPADAASIGAAAPADAASIDAAAPADAASIGAAAPADDCPVSIQTIANAYVDYTRKSLQESGSFAGKLMGVRSFDNAIEVQTEFTRQALANFVAESQKICELYVKLATQIFRPWEGLASKGAQGGRQMAR
jgi:hypothetical protein